MSYIKLQNKNLKKIALVDCNSFYVSCERLFNPRISKLPVVVLSNNDGCVISRSVEAKKIGIKMGEPYFKLKSKKASSIEYISIVGQNFFKIRITLLEISPYNA